MSEQTLELILAVIVVAIGIRIAVEIFQDRK
jgi:hypothetical protein